MSKSPAARRTDSLFARIGGSAVLTTVVEKFYQKMLADPDMQPSFQNTNMAWLKQRQHQYLSQLLGGPTEYKGRAMKSAHASMAIETWQFDRAGTHLAVALSEMGLAPQIVDEVMGKVSALEEDIVTVHEARESRTSSATKQHALSTSMMQAMLDCMPINVMVSDLDCNITYINPASLRTMKSIENQMAVRADQVVGSNIDIFHKNPAHQRQMLANPKNLPHKTIIPIGEEKAELLASPIYDEHGKYVGTMVTWSLITEKLRTEQAVKDAQARNMDIAENAGAVSKVLQSLNAAKSADDAARITLDAVREAFGLAYGSYWPLDANGNALRFGVASGSANEEFTRLSAEMRFHEGVGLNGRAWKTRDLVFFADLGEIKDGDRASAARRAGLKSGIAFPVVDDAGVVGTMDFFSSETLHPSEDRLDALRNVARIVSGVMQRIAVAQAERQHQEELKAQG